MKIVQTQLPAGSDLSGIELLGQVAGDAIVSEAKAVIRGQIIGNLRVASEASVEIYGHIGGDVLVEGTVVLYGWVQGRVTAGPFGSVTRMPGSIVER